MDIKSIVRVFRFGEMQSRADRDPSQKRPPTIMFLGLAVTFGLVALGIMVIASQADQANEGSGRLLEDTDPTDPENTTSPSPTTPQPPPERGSQSAAPALATRD